MKFVKAARRARIALPFALIFAVFAALIFFPQRPREGAEGTARRIVRVWNVDTFEGGKGSRTAFVARAARRAEKEDPSVYYYVTSYSVEGFWAAAERGELPDVLSFGVGIGEITGFCRPLGGNFAGGMASEGCLALPWCAGGYVLYSLDGDFEAEGETAISQGGSNLACVAAALAGIGGAETDAVEGYVGFLQGKYRYLLGTQRDRCRFHARGVEVYEKPLGAFCDLYQCVAVLSEAGRAEGGALVDALLSEELQGELGDIGMARADEAAAEWTVSVFTPPAALEELAAGARQGDVAKFPDKFLKKV